MHRIIGIAFIAGLCASAALAQQQYNAPKTVRQATAGETCGTSYKGCLDWCDRNRGTNSVSENTGCKSSCSRYEATCVQTGTWSTPLGTTEIRGLPPK